jgi:carbon-monoxide dehydrogenase medium subunit
VLKASQFEYHRPGSLDQAVELLARYGSDAQVLAGGQSLMPLLALRRARPEHLVDVQRLGELAGMGRTDGLVRFGAMVRHRQVECDGSVPPLMRLAARISRSATAARWVGRWRSPTRLPSGRRWRWRWTRCW